MEWLDSFDSRKLLRFFRGNQAELSRVENSDLFLGKMRDCELIPQHKYEEVRRTRKEARRNKALYELLEWFVKETPENIRLFWRCAFQQSLMEQCPTLRRLHSKLTSGWVMGGRVTGGRVTGGRVTGGRVIGRVTGGRVIGWVMGGRVTGGRVTGGRVTGGRVIGWVMGGRVIGRVTGSRVIGWVMGGRVTGGRVIGRVTGGRVIGWVTGGRVIGRVIGWVTGGRVIGRVTGASDSSEERGTCRSVDQSARWNTLCWRPDGSSSRSARRGSEPPPSPRGPPLQTSPPSTMKKTLGPSTRSVYLSLAFVSLLLHLLLALFCLSVLQTACVLPPPSSSSSSPGDGPQPWSHKQTTDRCEDSLGGPGSSEQGGDRRNGGAGEVRKLISDEEVGAIVKGRSKLEALFKHPLYNLPLPELQEEDRLLRVKSEEDSRISSYRLAPPAASRTAHATILVLHLSSRLVGQGQPGPGDSSDEKGYYKLDWTSDASTHPPWLRFHLNINRWRLYDRNDPSVADLSHHLATQRIIGAVQMSGGTQLKLILSFPNHGRALLKPMKQTRDAETDSNLFYFSDFERHNAEISAFHLDRVLGFNRIPPVVGRLINVTADVREITTDRRLAKTFFSSPGLSRVARFCPQPSKPSKTALCRPLAGNVCFYGSCDYYCSTEHPVCGRPHALEVSVAVMLPDTKVAPRRSWRSPWRRSYSRSKLAAWETDPDYCDLVKQTPPYDSGTRLLDLMDMVILDFLMSECVDSPAPPCFPDASVSSQGNMDRHHYETFEGFGNETFLLHLDNGRAFGRHSRDEPSILAPLQQCCRIRQSTLLRLELLSHSSFRLSDVMRESLAQDPLTVVAPLLTEPHLSALDRRLATVLQVVKTCQEHHRDVTFDDLDDK
ncbi:uncharacterized protein ACB057_016552 [Neosynchiropus ocellatus]